MTTRAVFAAVLCKMEPAISRRAGDLRSNAPDDGDGVLFVRSNYEQRTADSLGEQDASVKGKGAPSRP